MTNIKFGWKNLVLYFAALCLGVGALTAQPQHQPGAPGPPPRDPLMGLKHALAEAGAPALSTQQEQQLTQLIEAAHEGRPKGPNETLQAAHRAYDNAVIAGNVAAAGAQAAIIAQQIGTETNARLQAEAKFKIDALNALKNNANQVTALTQRFGTAGLSHLLNSLVGGPDGPGGPPPPPPNGGRGPGGRP